MNLKKIFRKVADYAGDLYLNRKKNDTFYGVAGSLVYTEGGKKKVEYHGQIFDFKDLERYLYTQYVRYCEEYGYDADNEDFKFYAQSEAVEALYNVAPIDDSDPWEDDDYYGEDLVEEDALADVVDSQKVNDAKKEYNYAKDGNYTHYAVNKETNLIIDGWDYHGYDGDELRQFKRDYFFDDLEETFDDIDLKKVTILTEKGCMNRGIDPFNNDNWTNVYPLKK